MKKNEPRREPRSAAPARKLAPPDLSGPRGSSRPTASPGRRWLFRLLALLVIPVVLLGGVEAGLRLWGYGYPTHFFLPSRVHGQNVWIENQKFGWRFFPPTAARTPRPVVMPATKPPRTYRIFLLGESAAYGDPDPDFGFGRILEVLLRERFPGTRFEVINAAMTAINSHVLLPIARDCAHQQGDLWVIYMGNNEVVGPFGAGTVFGPQAPGLGFIRASVALKTLKLGQLVDELRRRVADPQSATRAWGGMEMFAPHLRRQEDPRMATVYAHFQRNLSDILRLATTSGARVVVSTVLSNLKDCAPFASLHRPDLTGTQKAEWDKAYQEGIVAQSSNQLSQGVAAYERAAKVDDRYADLHFRWAQCYWSLGDFIQAKKHFLQARDGDALRFRADSTINEIIRQTAVNAALRQTAQHRGNPAISFLDAAEVLAEKCPHAIPDGELLYEHVHLRFAGNYWLARCVADEAARDLARLQSAPVEAAKTWLTPEEAAQELAFTDWNRYETEEQIRQRLEFVPFTQQLDHLEQYQRIKNEVDRLRRTLSPAALKSAVEIYRAALSRVPDDWCLHENLGRLLQKVGDFGGALAQWRQASEWLPHNPEAHYQLGMALDQVGLSEEAIAQFQRALSLEPNLAEALNGLGLALANQGRYAEAIADYQAALRLKPDFAGAHVNLGLAYSHLGNVDEAKAQYARALRLKPNNVAAYVNLGKILNSEGKISEAATNYAEALRLNPDDALAHFNYANTLRLLGRMPEAAEHYAESVRIDPEFAEAHCQLGFEYARQGKDAEARQQFAEAIRLKPDYSEAHLNLGVALIKQQRIEEAIQHFQEALRLDPNYATAKKYLEAAQALQRKQR